MQTLEEKIKSLPPELRKEVEDFVGNLLDRFNHRANVKLRQDWAGALKEYRGKYTSVELQKKALEWRGD